MKLTDSEWLGHSINKILRDKAIHHCFLKQKTEKSARLRADVQSLIMALVPDSVDAAIFFCLKAFDEGNLESVLSEWKAKERAVSLSEAYFDKGRYFTTTERVVSEHGHLGSCADDLFLGYLSMPEEGATDIETVELYLSENPTVDRRMLGEQLSSLAAIYKEDTGDDLLLRRFGCSYDPRERGLSPLEWLNQLGEHLITTSANTDAEPRNQPIQPRPSEDPLAGQPPSADRKVGDLPTMTLEEEEFLSHMASIRKTVLEAVDFNLAADSMKVEDIQGDVLPKAVDSTLFYILKAIDNGDIKLFYKTKTGERLIDLEEEGMCELAGSYVARFQKRRLGIGGI